jgi:exportin-7
MQYDSLQAEASRSFTKHRKIASSFRDSQLFEIFELGCNLLKKAYEMIKTIDYNDADQVENKFLLKF